MRHPLLTVSSCTQSFQQYRPFLTAMDLTTLVTCAIFAILILKTIWRPGRSKSVPGPKFSFPILGHLPLIGKEPWVTFLQWKKLYGPMFAIKMGMYDVIVLNESKLIKEAFARPELCGRPPFELFKAGAQGKGIVFSDGPLVAEQRNFAQKCLRGFGFRTNLLEENNRLELNQVLGDIDKKCGRPVAINGMFGIPLMNAGWSIFMGQRFEHDDPQLHRLHEGVKNTTTNEGPMTSLAPFIPAISKFLPELSGYNKQLRGLVNIYAFMKKAFDEPLPPTRTPGDPQNFKEAFIDEMERVGDNWASSFHPTHNFFQYTAGDIFIGLVETVSTTLDWLLLYMVKHPLVQKKVQVEIDENIGTTRVPALSDKVNTPYVEAVIQELLRFSSVAPLSGILHRATEDSVLHGFTIQKDTLIIGNTYGVHYDSDVWGDPENFRPERFINDSGAVDRNLMRTMLPFGTGRRSCIGESLARDQTYLYCTSIFQRLNVSCDEDIQIGNTVGIARAPKEFKLTFTKRFAE